MIRIKITDGVLQHLEQHFQPGIPGSKFNYDSPQRLLEEAIRIDPRKFKEAVPECDNRARITIVFPHEIGLTNVIAIKDLTAEEKKTIKAIDRGGKYARVAFSDRDFPTNECQFVLEFSKESWYLITMFPGELAPPLPDTAENSPEYWKEHVFTQKPGEI